MKSLHPLTFKMYFRKERRKVKKVTHLFYEFSTRNRNKTENLSKDVLEQTDNYAKIKL